MDLGELARKLVEDSRLCVLATASKGGKPEAATIQYASKGFTLYFETMSMYRKYANLIINPQASVVITEFPNTLQMDGTVQDLADSSEAVSLLTAKISYIPKFYAHPDIRFFKFTPTWIRVQDKGWPPRYEEILISEKS